MSPEESLLFRIEEFRRFATNPKHTEFGLCAKCRHMAVRTHEAGSVAVKVAFCEMFIGPHGALLRLSPAFPVRDCARYWPIGAPTLREMLAEAKLIELRTVLDPGYR
jgi:hypothetical protein